MNSLTYWWQHLPENINPVLFAIGPVQIRFYGIMYLMSFLVVFSILLHRIKNEKFNYTREQCEDYIVWAVLGALIGARIGYILFYDFSYFLHHPVEVFWPFKHIDGVGVMGISGLSYHGGLVGVIIATILFCKKQKFQLWAFADFFVPAVPLGYTCGRIGNFLNGELWGRVTLQPWGMYFPFAPTYELRHPSQLYEAFFEGIVLFLILWTLRKKEICKGYLFFVYLFGYGIFRFCIEFFRQPDEQLGFVINHLSMGQILSILMIIIPIIIFIQKPKWIRK
ncbi:MAG: prolipoprotein diacylglyceryl transferase [Candidatus Omnitrophica bacterium]|nr:prolipoprotein diacylglyceryl transferase [Candidatus Omnitrophota bacterium]